jgi:transcriptional regulator with XRE-family HTH domain
MPSPAYSTRYGKFREALVAARKSAPLSQEALAARLGKPQSFISKYERGERRLDVGEFFEIADAIGIDPIEFLRRIYRR